MAVPGSCIAMQTIRQAALTTHNASKVHFNPVGMGRQLSAQWEMPQMMAVNGMPTTKRPAIPITKVGNGETTNAKSVMAGNNDTNAAPPPISNTSAMNSKATNPTPQANKNGLQTIARTINTALIARPMNDTKASPTLLRNVRGLPDAT